MSLTRNQPLPPPVEGDASLPYDISNLRSYSLAVSGEVFRWIIDYAPPEIMQRVSDVARFSNLILTNDRCSFVGRSLLECPRMRSTS